MTDYTALSIEIQSWIREAVSTAGAKGVVLGLSGGVDSGLAAALASRALGKENVLCLLLPCRSLPEDLDDAERLASILGVQQRVIDLEPVLASLEKASGLDPSDRLQIANVKARLRMTVIYAHSRDRLVLGTSNYSEILVGYWTKWGDGAADIQPLARMFKDEINLLARELDLPGWLISRIPSAGLWPGQSDEGEMGVTYMDVRRFFSGELKQSEACRRIEEMVSRTEHKRNPIPFFDARKWIDNE